MPRCFASCSATCPTASSTDSSMPSTRPGGRRTRCSARPSRCSMRFEGVGSRPVSSPTHGPIRRGSCVPTRGIRPRSAARCTGLVGGGGRAEARACDLQPGARRSSPSMQPMRCSSGTASTATFAALRRGADDGAGALVRRRRAGRAIEPDFMAFTPMDVLNIARRLGGLAALTEKVKSCGCPSRVRTM